MVTNKYHSGVFINQAKSGHHPFSNLVRLSAELLSINPDIVMAPIYQVMDTDVDPKSTEAIIRRIWTARPTARQLVVLLPICNAGVTQVLDLGAAQTTVKAMYEAYGIPIIDFRQFCIDNIGDLATYMADEFHPTVAGQAQITTMITDYFTANPTFLTDDADHTTLPARQISGSDEYENTPQIISGRDGVTTGAGWSDVGTTGVQSGTAGDTITFTATCSCFGNLTLLVENGDINMSIDGGAFTDVGLGPNGYSSTLERGEHTFTMKVRAGQTLRIDEFWAV